MTEDEAIMLIDKDLQEVFGAIPAVKARMLFNQMSRIERLVKIAIPRYVEIHNEAAKAFPEK